MFLGIDPSLTGTGFTVVDRDYKIISMEKLSTPTMGVERLFHLEIKLLKFLDTYQDIIYVCIEGPAMRESGRLHDLGQWAGLIYLNLYKRGIPFFLAAPLQLKKYVSGEGKSRGKEVVLLDIYKNFGEEIRDDDIGDAYVLARIARDMKLICIDGEDSSSLKKYQTEVLTKIYDYMEAERRSLL